MRIDKFLKTALIFKTRNSGEKLIEEGYITINDKPAKPASDVKIGDIIKVKNVDKITHYKVLEIFEKNVSKELAKTMYQIIHEENID